MALPLFEEPAAPPAPATTVERVDVEHPAYRSFCIGFRQGSEGQGESFKYSDDEQLNRYYKDGHRIGRLFLPLPCMRRD